MSSTTENSPSQLPHTDLFILNNSGVARVAAVHKTEAGYWCILQGEDGQRREVSCYPFLLVVGDHVVVRPNGLGNPIIDKIIE